jgi:phage terminase large subunit-like protein
MQVQEKCTKRYKFEELVLVLGRRSGKSFLVSAMALYELYRLISMGHPQARYGLMEFDEVVILNVARNEEQAKKAIFSKIKQTVLASPFFAPYIGKDTELEMRFYTEHDREENVRRKEQNINLFAGSLVLRCGSSNASGLVGLTCWTIIMDEVAAMAGDNPESGVDYALYDDLKPSLATFGKDGKMMLLSNPKGPLGLLYDLHENRQEDPTTLVMRLPTWLTNPNIDKEWLDGQKKKDPQEFQMQYGAEFGASSSDPMFNVEDVDRMFSSMSMVKRKEQAEGHFEYFCHLDPARTSDYYALVIAHTENMYGQIGPDFQPLKRVVIDHIHFWNPRTKNQPVKEKDVEDYVIELHRKFKFKQVSIDQWNSQSSLITLQSRRIPIVERQFNKEYKEKIYTELSQLVRDDRIDIYDLSGGEYRDLDHKLISLNEVQEAKIQFLFLQKKWKGKRYYIEALSGYKDDICDAVAAVAYECLTSKIMIRLPRSKMVNLNRR